MPPMPQSIPEYRCLKCNPIDFIREPKKHIEGASIFVCPDCGGYMSEVIDLSIEEAIYKLGVHAIINQNKQEKGGGGR